MNTATNYLNGKEMIAIAKCANGYQIYYGIQWSENTNRWEPACHAGTFPTFAEAHKTLKKHRPNAKIQAFYLWEPCSSYPKPDWNLINRIMKGKGA